MWRKIVATRTVAVVLGVFFLAALAASFVYGQEAGVTIGVEVPNPLDPLIAEVEAARRTVEELRNIGEAAERVEESVRNLEHLEIRLESKRIEIAALDTGYSAWDIEEMRRSGLGWGEIAKMTGVHPGSLGLGHGNKVKAGGSPSSGQGGKGKSPGQAKKAVGKGKNK
jgi:hypothetical protein